MATATGYAARFWDPTDPGTEYALNSTLFERIDRNAFTKTLGKRPVWASLNHNPDTILGRSTVRAATLRLGIDKLGLWYSVDLPPSPTGENVRVAIERGDVFGSSFTFLVQAQRLTEETRQGQKVIVRWLTEIDLIEVGPVVQPAYSAASVGLLLEGGS